MANITSAESSIFKFMKLPAELQKMIIKKVDDEVFYTLRLVSRALLAETNEEFADRFLTNIYLILTVANVKLLDKVLRSPNLAPLTPRTRGLCVYLPTLTDLPLTRDGVLWHSLPSRKRVIRLLKAMPNLSKVLASLPRLVRDGDEVQYRIEHELLMKSQAIESILLPALARVGTDLIKTRGSLLSVELAGCELTGTQEMPVTWRMIFSTLLTMELEHLELDRLVDPKDDEDKVLFARSQGYGLRYQWTSSNPANRVTSMDMVYTFHNTYDDHEIDKADYYAVFDRTSVRLYSDCWVQKGLEILLGLADYPLYLDPGKARKASGSLGYL